MGPALRPRPGSGQWARAPRRPAVALRASPFGTPHPPHPPVRAGACSRLKGARHPVHRPASDALVSRPPAGSGRLAGGSSQWAEWGRAAGVESRSPQGGAQAGARVRRPPSHLEAERWHERTVFHRPRRPAICAHRRAVEGNALVSPLSGGRALPRREKRPEHWFGASGGGNSGAPGRPAAHASSDRTRAARC